MKKISLILLIFTLTSWTYEKPKDKHKDKHNNGHDKPNTLPLGDGIFEMLAFGAIYTLTKKRINNHILNN